MLDGRGTLQICSLTQVAITFNLDGFWFRNYKLILFGKFTVFNNFFMQKMCFSTKCCYKFPAISSFFQIFAPKMLKKHISTSVWSAQHPNAGQNRHILVSSNEVPPTFNIECLNVGRSIDSGVEKISQGDAQKLLILC